MGAGWGQLSCIFEAWHLFLFFNLIQLLRFKQHLDMVGHHALPVSLCPTAYFIGQS